jgi:hypothetical protein
MKLIQWARNKAGRIITSVGILLSGVENFDVTPIKDPLEGFLGHRVVMGLIVALFVSSYIRHQQIANRHAAVPLPPPQPDASR